MSRHISTFAIVWHSICLILTMSCRDICLGCWDIRFRHLPEIKSSLWKAQGAAGAGQRPGRSPEGVRRNWRISCTFDRLRRPAWRRVRGHRRKQAKAETHVRGREEPQKGCGACVLALRPRHDDSWPAQPPRRQVLRLRTLHGFSTTDRLPTYGRHGHHGRHGSHGASSSLQTEFIDRCRL